MFRRVSSDERILNFQKSLDTTLKFACLKLFTLIASDSSHFILVSRFNLLNSKKRIEILSGAASGSSGSPAVTGSAETASSSEQWQFSWEKFDAKITTTAEHTTGSKTGQVRTLSGGDNGSRGTGTVRQNVQTEADQARFHPRRRRTRNGQTLRQRLFANHHLQVERYIYIYILNLNYDEINENSFQITQTL